MAATLSALEMQDVEAARGGRQSILKEDNMRRVSLLPPDRKSIFEGRDASTFLMWLVLLIFVIAILGLLAFVTDDVSGMASAMTDALPAVLAALPSNATSSPATPNLPASPSGMADLDKLLKAFMEPTRPQPTRMLGLGRS